MSVPDVLLATICRRQFGVFAWAQARGVGLPDSTVARRVASGRYRYLQPGVLAEAGAPDSWEARAMAAQLAVGGEAVLARLTAARALGMAVPHAEAGRMSVLVRNRSFTGLDDVVVHRTRTLQGRDWTWLGALRATTPTRTLCDLAGCIRPGDLRRAVSDAVRRSATDAAALRVAAARLGRFRGKRALLAIVDELHPLDRDCRSELETRFLRVMRRARLPPSAMNHPVVDADGRRRLLDAVYLEQRLPIELDSRLAHGTLLDWHDDLRRENAVALTGWRPFLRFSWHDLVDRPQEVVATVRRALE